MHIFLVGPPGIGKSTVAPLLAGLLGASLVSLDAQVAKRGRTSAEHLIASLGMERFRDLESETLASLEETPAWVVVDTGGGAVVRDANRMRMRELGLVLGLSGSTATVARGLAQTMAKRVHIHVSADAHARAVLRERRAAYRDTDASFAVDKAEPDAIARAIASWLVASRGFRVGVTGTRSYPVVVRAGLLSGVGAELAQRGWRGRVAVVRDPQVARLHAPAVLRSLKAAGLAPVEIAIPGGERAKGLPTLRRVWDELGRGKIGRDGGVIALGGGSCGDLAGFAAATYLRGVPVAQVPTTLLAMVDSAIGGKTGIDLPAGKNLAGAFHPPAAVLADLTLLQSLPARQVSSGLAEIVKSAFLADRLAVAQVARSLARIRAGDLGPTLATVALTAQVKARVVSLDEHETSGLRELLNFGHTFGHAYEASSGYRVTHGEAVAIGLVFVTALATRLGLAPDSLRLEVESMLDAAGLPTRTRIPAATWGYLMSDKKVRAGKVRWIVPRRVGRFSEVTDVPERHLRAAAAIVTGTARTIRPVTSR